MRSISIEHFYLSNTHSLSRQNISLENNCMFLTFSMVRQRVSFIQYIPLWISIHLNSRYSNDRDKYQFLDAFLLSIYNSEAEMQTELKPVGSTGAYFMSFSLFLFFLHRNWNLISRIFYCLISTGTSANNSTSSSSQNPLQRPAFVKVPSLASSSIYHDSSQLKR